MRVRVHAREDRIVVMRFEKPIYDHEAAESSGFNTGHIAIGASAACDRLRLAAVGKGL